MVELTLVMVRPTAVEAMAIEFNETSAIGLLQWTRGILKCDKETGELELRILGDKPVNDLVAHNGDWVLYDGKFRVVPAMAMKTDYETGDEVTTKVTPEKPTPKLTSVPIDSGPWAFGGWAEEDEIL